MHLYIATLAEKMGHIVFMFLCSAGTADTTSHPLDQTFPAGDTKPTSPGGALKCEFTTTLILFAFEMMATVNQERISLNYNASST